MKVENKLVRIFNGKKNLTFQNHITDKYLSLFAKRQYQNVGNEVNLNFKRVLLKFDSPVENPEDKSEYQEHLYGNISYDYSYNYFKVNYDYLSTDLQNVIPKEWIGHKIYGIAFMVETEKYQPDKEYVGAYLDVSDYDIYIGQNAFVNIYREDVISSEAICNEIPYHLAPFYTDDGTTYKIGKVYSVGFGNNREKIDEEYIIGDDVELESIENGFKFKIGGTLDFTLYPSDENYPSNGTYPMRLIVNTPEITPQNDLYPSDDIYPLITNYKYIIIKYNVCNVDSNYKVTSTNDYYLMAYPYTRKGTVTVKVKYERNDI